MKKHNKTEDSVEFGAFKCALSRDISKIIFRKDGVLEDQVSQIHQKLTNPVFDTMLSEK